MMCVNPDSCRVSWMTQKKSCLMVMVMNDSEDDGVSGDVGCNDRVVVVVMVMMCL